MIEIKFKKVRENATTPIRATEGSVGFDLCAYWDGENNNTKTIHSGETVKIGTGIAIGEMYDEFGSPFENYGAFIFARSGLAAKEGLAPANKVGVVDMDYRGEIIVALRNHSEETRVIQRGDRIAQLVFIPVFLPGFIEDDLLDSTARGAGGFGSTGR